MTPDDFEAKAQRLYNTLTGKAAAPMSQNDKEALALGMELACEVACSFLRVRDALEQIARDGIGHKRPVHDAFDGL